jgi:hypothetical protein
MTNNYNVWKTGMEADIYYMKIFKQSVLPLKTQIHEQNKILK